MNRFLGLRAVALPIVVLFLAACGGQQAASVPTEVHVTLREFTVEMDKTSIPAGPVTFIIENAGGLEHELVLEKAGDNDVPFEADGVESEAEAIAPGSSASFDWTIDEPGQYQLACHVDQDGVDHFGLGMLLTFTVTEK
ncbi:MAG: hypothetical protein E4G99_05060 [Anaerolineales bacterium]|nr:MAG: hypothetical protein E4G99_05060 [Anaerolineales bacterium]